MIFQVNGTDLWNDISYDFGLPILSLVILVMMMLFMLYFYTKVKKMVFVLLIYVFSLPFGLISLGEYNIPFSPWFQLFFLMFQTIIFFMSAMKFRRLIK